MNRSTLHPSQLRLLELLGSSTDEPMTVRQLQELIGASSPSVVSHHLSQLEKKGFLRRNPFNPRDYQVIRDGQVDEAPLLHLDGAARCGPGGSILDGAPIDRLRIAARLLSFPVSEAFMVRAEGNSMTPRIGEGDLVIARRTELPENGRVYVCVNDGECLIKRVRLIDDQILLESFNSSEFPIFKASDDFFQVEGEVKHVISGGL